jgi:hypothetical protein
MSDIFREVEEDLRRARIEALWKRFGNHIVAAAVVLVVAVGGWRYWTHIQEEKAAAAGAQLDEAEQMARGGKTAEAEKALESIIANAPSGYRMLARFSLAGEMGKRDATEGIGAFDALASDASLDPTLRDLARLRAAMLVSDRGGDAKEVAARAEPLTQPSNPWRNTARELMGLSALKAGDFEAAGRWFDQIIIDPAAPANLRQRTQGYLALVRGGPVTATSTQ